MKNTVLSKSAFEVTALIICSAAIVGCAPISGSSTQSTVKSGVRGFTAGTGYSQYPDPAVVNPNPSPSPTSTQAQVTGSAPTHRYTVQGVGYTAATTINVRAGSILKIKFTPGQASGTISNSGYSAVYSALGVYVRVGATEKATPLLSNGLRSAAQSAVLDFSGTLNLNCAQVTDCRQTYTVVVTRPNYDYACLNDSRYCFQNPPWTQVHENHPWNGQLEIQTDDTVALGN